MTAKPPLVEQEQTTIAPDVERQITPINWRVARLSLIYLALDYCVRAVPHSFRLGGEYTRGLSVLFALGLAAYAIATSPGLRNTLGLTWRQRPGSLPLSLICVLASSIVAGLLVFVWPPQAKDALSIFRVSVTVPLSEELAYRGIAFAALLRAFGGRSAFWPVFISTVCFAFAHVLKVRPGLVEFVPLQFLLGAVLGLLCSVARAYSGSLVFAVLCHAAWNATLNLLPFLR